MKYTDEENKLRIRLIGLAADPKERTIYYGEIMEEFGYGPSYGEEPAIFYKMLDKISLRELEASRPALSSVVIGRIDNRPGPGFFKMGSKYTGKKATELKRKFWDTEQLKATFDEWKGKSLPIFFKEESLNQFSRDASTDYKSGDTERGTYVKEDIWPVIDAWAKRVCDELGWQQLPFGKQWQNSGKFKWYIWTQILPTDALRDDIFFTLDYNAKEEGAKIKLDYHFSKDHWTDRQRKLLETDVDRDVLRLLIPKETLLTEYDIDLLVVKTVDYIRENIGRYQELVRMTEAIAPRRPSDDEVSEIPEPQPGDYIDPSGRDINFLARAARQQMVGDAGEKWVLKKEQERTADFDLTDKQQEKIKITPSSAAYDIDSFDDDGKAVIIEVKTTTLGLDTPFYMSKRERDYMNQELGRGNKYRIHRVYNLDLLTGTAECKVYHFPEEDLDFGEVTSFIVTPKK